MGKLIHIWTRMNEKYQVWTREGHRELTEAEWRIFDSSLLHRTDGPAVIHPNGTQCWYQNGQRHRTDGPAVIFTNGLELWFLNDRQLSTNGVESWIKTNDIDLSRSQDQLIFLTKWGSG